MLLSVLTHIKLSDFMQKKETNTSTDLQKFIEKFEPNKFKLLARGIEIRGNNDLHRSITFAKELIEKMKLKLTVHHSAEMALYGGFEVVYAK
ncbi:hypothetical protein Phep_0650 [Pedobacter heparinus DSM 2366]|uniref:Uncharacterized protein n=2 Tax=Sphingobacteriaceae TaxID=84566 RepID=C6Y196_PEDHD|nr:hypothetical protein Phep_0650 [Pedobacter heparinus DSM 2366]